MRGMHLSILLIMMPAILYSQTKSDKRGIAYGKHSTADMAAISGNVSWWYNWYHAPESAVAAVYQNYGMDYVPMAWNGSFNEAGMRAFYASHPDAKYLLGFNEPNFTTQANMKPSQAAAIWPKLEKIAKDYNLKIVAPAVNYADKPVTENGVTYTDPIAYLDAFFAACPNCQVDYIAVHNYMCYTTALASDIARYKKYKRPIWLTEFACWDQQNITLDMQKSYLLGAIDYLETDTSVFRYSWFAAGNRSGAYPYLDLFKAQSGQLTDLGKLYINFNPVHDTASYTLIPARIEAESYTTMSGIAIEATKDVSGIADVGWIDPNDWLEYFIDVATQADYNLFFRISANASSNIIIRENGVALKTLLVPSSGGWQNWKTLKTTLALTPGKHKLQIFTSKGQFNLNWLEITTASQPTLVWDTGLAKEKVFPNPVREKLTIESDFLTPETQITVIDIHGSIIYRKSLEERTSRFEINFNTFRSGSYIVQVKNNNHLSNYLIIK
jgi:hypothetical protein